MWTLGVLDFCIFFTLLCPLTSRQIMNYANFEDRSDFSNDHNIEQGVEDRNTDLNRNENNNFYERQPATSQQLRPDVGDADTGALSSINELHNLTEEEERLFRIEMIKLELLRQIPDLAPPNATMPRVPAPLRFTEEPVIQRDEPDQPKVSQVVFFAEPAPARCKRNGICIFFNLNSSFSYENIHSVELWLYKRRSHDHSNHTYVVSKLPSRHYNGKKRKPISLASERVGINPGWTEFKDVTLRDKVMRWVADIKLFPNKIGSAGHLMITCPTCLNEAPPIVTAGDKKPFLAINFKKINKRYKRRTQWCDNDQRSCCKKMFRFNFRDAGLNAFLQPSEYQPNYCQGSCEIEQYPEIINMLSTPYVSLIMQSRAIRERNKEPCCAPNKLSPTTVLYYNKNMLIVRKTLEKMVVESCGCH